MEKEGLPKLLGGLLATRRVTLEVEVRLHRAHDRHAFVDFSKIENATVARSQNVHIGPLLRFLPIHRLRELIGYATPINLGALIPRHRGIAPRRCGAGQRQRMRLRLGEGAHFLLGFRHAKPAEIAERAQGATAPHLCPFAQEFLGLAQEQPLGSFLQPVALGQQLANGRNGTHASARLLRQSHALPGFSRIGEQRPENPLTAHAIETRHRHHVLLVRIRDAGALDVDRPDRDAAVTRQIEIADIVIAAYLTTRGGDVGSDHHQRVVAVGLVAVPDQLVHGFAQLLRETMRSHRHGDRMHPGVVPELQREIRKLRGFPRQVIDRPVPLHLEVRDALQEPHEHIPSFGYKLWSCLAHFSFN